MRSYKVNDPGGWGGDPARGAALGRNDIHDEPKTYEGVLKVERVKIDADGYDPNGTYFGIGSPLFWVSNEEGSIDYVLRATDKANAKDKVKRRYPQVSFA